MFEKQSPSGAYIPPSQFLHASAPSAANNDPSILPALSDIDLCRELFVLSSNLRDAAKEEFNRRSHKDPMQMNDALCAAFDLYERSQRLEMVRQQIREDYLRCVGTARSTTELTHQHVDWTIRAIGNINMAFFSVFKQQQTAFAGYWGYTTGHSEDLMNELSTSLVVPLTKPAAPILYTPDATAALLKEKIAAFELGNVIALMGTYLNEPLSAIVMFRDEPISPTDIDRVACVMPIYSGNFVRTATIAEKPNSSGREHQTTEPPPREQDEWWQKGDPPPY